VTTPPPALQAFFESWVRRHPEEASTLGIHAGVLSDPSLEAIEDEARDLRATLAALPTDADPIDHDRAAVESWCRHELDRVEHGDHLANVELGLLPYHLLRHFLVHARSEDDHALASARARAIPAFLAAHERTLERGLAEGARACAGTVEWIAGRTIPAITDALAGMGHEGAARAYAAHGRMLAGRVLPAARASGALGHGRVVTRLRASMALDRSPEELIAEAREALSRAHEGLLACASRVLGGTPDLDEVRRVIAARLPLPIAGDPIPHYEALVTRATTFARAHGLVPLPDPLGVRVQALPPAISEAVHAQNWAAPLRDPSPRADFLVAPERARHPAIAAPLLAVHEGVPGHSLQSLAFARAHGGSAAPVRFLLVADDVAMARSSFGAMLSIEGWASWVEHRMLELGFYEGEAELYAWSVRAHRAARVIADLSLHTEADDEDACAALLVRNALVPEANARREIARYRRIPLQALTYLTGALAVERTLARGVTIDALLAAGPVPPDRLGA
jgi:hypothetical protein